jgi:sec-independent protein translocase protein TatC
VVQDDESAVAAAGGKTMGFLGHLEELRWTLIKCAVVFAIYGTVIAYQLDRATEILNWPLSQVQGEFPKLKTDLVTNSPMSVFSAVIDICLMGGVITSLPFWLFFVGQFVAPALTKKEMKVIVPTGLAALVLFSMGTAFGYFFLTPSTIRVAFELNQMMGYTVMWAADRYYSLLLWMTLGMGAAFEFPLLWCSPCIWASSRSRRCASIAATPSWSSSSSRPSSPRPPTRSTSACSPCR